MKNRNHAFSTFEGVLLPGVLLLILLVPFYWFIYNTMNDNVKSLRAEREMLEMQYDELEIRLTQLTRMQTELDRLELSINSTRMPSYNNSKAEVSLLNSILEPTEQYSIMFENVTRDGDQIRRNFLLQFKTDSFDSAVYILRRLTESEYRCLLGNMNYSTQYEDDGRVTVSIDVRATFYETMVGGVSDAGLPSDETNE